MPPITIKQAARALRFAGSYLGGFAALWNKVPLVRLQIGVAAREIANEILRGRCKSGVLQADAGFALPGSKI